MSCEIPLGALTVVSGVSGSGKSTLAFDTLYAEGQRRYVASLSTYARQFLERLPRPEADAISQLPPAVAIERRNRVTSARSTVGTATEISDRLRLLFAHAGETRCPDCDLPAQPGDVAAVAARLAERFAGRRVLVTVPVPRRTGESGARLRERLVRDGHTRLLEADGTLLDLAELSAREILRRREARVLIDRFALNGSSGQGARVTEAVAGAFQLGEGVCEVRDPEGDSATYREGFGCDACGRRFPEPVPALFSFNSPIGACPGCQGFGRVPGLDRERVIPDPRLALRDGAVLPFTTPSGRRAQRKLLAACAEAGVPVDRPVEELEAETLDWLFEGEAGGWSGIRGFFRRLERKRYKVQNRVLIARYRRFDPCPDCAGARLGPSGRAVNVAGCTLPELSARPLGELAQWLSDLSLPAAAGARVGRVLADLRARVDTAVEAGLHYIALDRPLRTLSGGEAQRIQLASALGGTLTRSLYVLDEPSVGLHASDLARLVGILRRIRDGGNTVVVVEHAPELITAADRVIELGPGAGRLGGELVFQGDVETLREADTATGRALRQRSAPAFRTPRPARGRLELRGASEHNLCDVDVDFPLGQLVVVCGVSGAGKSTLVRSVLVGQLRREPDRGACRALRGAEALADVVWVEPQPPNRSPRSNAATTSGAFDPIRRCFAATREARERGLAPGFFSFNVAGGRCEHCEGSGEIVVDLQFLDDLRMTCDQCDGTRYRPEVRELRWRGESIVDVLAMSVDEALECFAAERAVADKLTPLARVGLGYLALGQPLSTLSGGEAQRLRLAQALSDGKPGSLYVFDEPSAGLHPADVQRLLVCFDALIEAGSSVLVTEHDLDVIRAADTLIELGPGAGPEGGRVVYSGEPAELARAADSPTGRALRHVG